MPDTSPYQIEPLQSQENEPTPYEIPVDAVVTDEGLSNTMRIIVTAILGVLLLISEFPLGTYLSSSDSYQGVNATLDSQKTTALGLAATSTAASVAVSAVPDDVGTPIAEQLADLSGKLMVVLAVIYFEKFLLTTFGFLGFRIFVPIGLALFIWYLWTRRSWNPRSVILIWGAKLLVVGVAMATLVPVSTALTDAINTQYQTSQQAEAAVQATDEATQDVADSTSSDQDTSANQSFLDMLGSAVSNGVNALASGAEDAAKTVGSQLNSLIDAVAVSIVTACLVPMAVLFVYIWIIKLLTGADLTGYVAKAQAGAAGTVAKAQNGVRAAKKSLKRQ